MDKNGILLALCSRILQTYFFILSLRRRVSSGKAPECAVLCQELGDTEKGGWDRVCPE